MFIHMEDFPLIKNALVNGANLHFDIFKSNFEFLFVT